MDKPFHTGFHHTFRDFFPGFFSLGRFPRKKVKKRTVKKRSLINRIYSLPFLFSDVDDFKKGKREYLFPFMRTLWMEVIPLIIRKRKRHKEMLVQQLIRKVFQPIK